MLQNMQGREKIGISCPLGAFLVSQIVKNLPAMWKTWVRLLGWEDPLEKGMATHSRFWPGEFHGQKNLTGYSPWSHRVRHN